MRMLKLPHERRVPQMNIKGAPPFFEMEGLKLSRIARIFVRVQVYGRVRYRKFEMAELTAQPFLLI